MTDEEKRQIEIEAIMKMSGVIVTKKSDKKSENKEPKKQTKGAK